MSFVGPVRHILRSNPAWVTGRRWQREGFVTAFRRSLLWRQVLETSPVRTGPRSPSAVEVHIACHKLDHLTAIWALKTFYRTAGVDLPLVIHVNGAAEQALCDRFSDHFPDATLVTRDVADKYVESRLIAGRADEVGRRPSLESIHDQVDRFPATRPWGRRLGIR